MRARDCKIVATMGPASDPPERLAMLVEAGVDCFRLNFSHGGREDHARRLANIRAAEAKIGKPIGVLADLQGPKIRVGSFADGEIKLKYGQIVTLEASNAPGDDKIILTGSPVVVDHSVNWTWTGDELEMLRGERQIRGKNPRFTGPAVKDLGVDKPKAAEPAPAAAPKQP